MSSTAACPAGHDLLRFALGEASNASAQQIEQHLQQCPRCRQRLHVLTADDTVAEGQQHPGETVDAPQVAMLENVKRRLHSWRPRHTGPPPEAAGDALPDNPEPTAVAAQGQYAFLAPAQGPEELGRLGSYRVLKVLGAGGMGVVFEAEDLHLKRRVALKVMSPALAANESARKRFLREAQATAALEHDHIVAIHQVGEDRGVLFLAMQLLHGETLDERLRREGATPAEPGSRQPGRSRALPVTEVLRIGREIAEGLAAAHARGLIHRDIKPANIFLASGGAVKAATHHSPLTTHHSPRVKILDLGLARPAEDDAHLTQSGVITGTPQYMAPEQAAGAAVDHRCDLFSLGCVLYRMSTGTLPFKGSSTVAVLQALALEQPKPPQELNPNLPPPLADLITRLLAKDPRQRPQTAQAVVEAIAELEHKLSEPRASASEADHSLTFEAPKAASASYRSLAVAARKRRRVLIAALLALFLVGLLAWGTTVLLRTKDGVLEVTVMDGDVEVLVDHAQQKVVLRSDKTGRIELAPGEHKLIVRRGEEELYTESFTLKSGGKKLIEARWTPKAVAKSEPNEAPKTVAKPESQNQLVTTGVGEVLRFQIDPHVILSVAFSADGRYALTGNGNRLLKDGKQAGAADSDYTVRLWDLTTGREVGRFAGHIDMVRCTAFSSDGQRVIATCQDGTLRQWDIASGEEVAIVRTKPRWNVGAAIDPMRRRVLLGYADGRVRLWDLDTGRLLQELKGHAAEAITSLAFSPDGRLGLSGGGGEIGKTGTGTDFALRLWDLQEGKELGRLEGHTDHVRGIVFSPDGSQALSGSFDGSMRLWDIATRKELKRVEAQTWAVAFSHDARRAIAGGAWNGTLQLWDLATGTAVHSFPGHSSRVRSVAYSPDGRHALAGYQDGTVRLFRLPGPEPVAAPLPGAAAVGEVHCFQIDPHEILSVAFSADGRHALTGNGQRQLKDGKQVGPPDADYTVRLWDLTTGREVGRFPGHTRIVWCTAFSSDGRRAITASNDGTLRQWDIASGKEVATVRTQLAGTCGAAIDAGRRRVLLGYYNGLVRLWDLDTGRLVHALKGHAAEAITGLAFSPDGRLALSGGGGEYGKGGTGTDFALRLWDLNEGKEIGRLEGHTDQVRAIMFSADGSQALSGSFDGSMRLWDIAARKELKRLQGRHGKLFAVAFSANDRRAIAGGGDGVLQLWDLASGVEVYSFPGRPAVRSVAPSPDGRHALAGYQDGTVRLFRLPEVDPPAFRPFIILARDGKSEQKLATLAEAVARAQSGDTIEIRGNGPFAIDPIKIENKALTIRAGPGWEPVLRSAATAAKDAQWLLWSNGRLVLEGLHVQHVEAEVAKDSSPFYLVRSQGAPLYVSQCRFSIQSPGRVYALDGYQSPVVQVRRCHFAGRVPVAISCHFPATGKLEVEDCLAHEVNVFIVTGHPETARDFAMRIYRNTFLGHSAVMHYYRQQPESPDDSDRKPIRIDARENVFDGHQVFTLVRNEKDKFEPDADLARLLYRLAWNGQENLYAGVLVALRHHDRLGSADPIRTLDDWRRYWGVAEPGSLQGRPRYQGGDLRAREEAAPEQLTPADFRLHPASAGFRAAAGRDLGADVDLVGPGPAYERWRKTPEYQRWREGIGTP
jgi:WD40 repeat protein/serine/threonine protein kinase